MLTHDVLNDLAVAMGMLEAFRDGKLAATRERFDDALLALDRAQACIAQSEASRSGEGENVVPRPEGVLGAIVEGSPYAKILVDGTGTITLVNAETEKLFGYRRQELVGRSVEVLVPSRFKDGHPTLRSAYDRHREARPMGAGRDLYGRRKDGSEFPIEIGLNPIDTESGTVTLAAISDITERKRAEEMRLLHAGIEQHAADLERLNVQLESASRFKTQFIATMSHELRTPLAAIVGATELLMQGELAPRQAVSAATIHEASEALLALIGSILDFSKIEAGKMDIRAEIFEVSRVVESAVEVATPLVAGKDVWMHGHVDPAIGSVVGDADRLRQILLNLLGNAAKFTTRGSIVVRATLLETQAASAKVVRFEVRDTGPGVDPSLREALFEPFSIAHGADRNGGGTGLGLSISKRLVELMGGEIGVESAVGAGSTFWFTAAFAQRAPAEAENVVQHVTTEPVRAREATRGRVLVAEDNDRLQRLIALQLEHLGVEVAFVDDGRAAVDAVRANSYALVLMDCHMPGLDGFAATRAIRASETDGLPPVPIVAMTASATFEDRERCLAAGMDDFLPKPFKLADLRSIASRWLMRDEETAKTQNGIFM